MHQPENSVEILKLKELRQIEQAFYPLKFRAPKIFPKVWQIERHEWPKISEIVDCAIASMVQCR
jgi:hypothetical protein